MSILTHDVEIELQEQFISIWTAKKDYQKLNVVCKISHPSGEGWKWYLISQDPEEENYLWGIVTGFDVEYGSIWKPDLESLKELGFRIDPYFKPIKAMEVFRLLRNGNEV